MEFNKIKRQSLRLTFDPPTFDSASFFFLEKQREKLSLSLIPDDDLDKNLEVLEKIQKKTPEVFTAAIPRSLPNQFTVSLWTRSTWALMTSWSKLWTRTKLATALISKTSNYVALNKRERPPSVETLFRRRRRRLLLLSFFFLFFFLPFSLAFLFGDFRETEKDGHRPKRRRRRRRAPFSHRVSRKRKGSRERESRWFRKQSRGRVRRRALVPRPFRAESEAVFSHIRFGIFLSLSPREHDDYD